MPFDSPAGRADVEFRAHTGQFKTDVNEARRVYEQTTNSMSTGALRAAAAQEKLDRAIARHGPDSLAAKNATIAYRREMEALAVQHNRVTATSTRMSGGLRETERELGRVGRGALVGTGLLHGLGRAAAFASTAFLGGAGLVYAIRTTINAAKEESVALHLTENALHASGLSWSQHRGQIEQTTRVLERHTGFQDDELLASFGKVVRVTGDVDKAFEIVGAAAQLARAQNISLESSTQLLIRAWNGQTRGLNRYLPAIAKVTTAQDALKASGEKVSAQQLAQAKAADVVATRNQVLALVQGKTAGAAAAFLRSDAGAQALFNVELHRSEEIIGQGVLPAFNGLLTQGADYLQHLNETGQLQRDVNRALRDGTQVVHGVRDAWRLVSVPMHAVTTALGGIDKAVETFLIVGAISKVARFAASFGLVRAASEATKDKVIGDAAQMNLALGGGGGLSPAGIPTGDLRSQGGGGGLRGSLNRISRRWPIQLQLIGAVAIAAALVQLQEKLDKLGSTKFQPQPGTGITSLGHGVSYDPASGQYINTGKGGAKGVSAVLSEQEAARRLGISVAALRRQQATGSGAPVDIRAGSGIQLPTSQRATHQTAGLAGFPAVDIMAKPGTAIRAPEDGMITRISGHEPGEAPPQGQGGPWGLTIYFVGSQTGNTYFMTHLMKVAQPGSYKRGDVIGLIGDYPGSSSDHVHFAIHKGASPEAHYASTLISPSDYLATPSGGWTGGTTKPPPPGTGLGVRFQEREIAARGAVADRPGAASRRQLLATLRDEVAEYTRLINQQGLKPGQRLDLERARLGVKEEISSITEQGARKAESEGKKRAAALAKAERERAKDLRERFRAAELNAKGAAALVQVYNHELAYEEGLAKQLRAHHAPRVQIDAVLLEEAQIRTKRVKVAERALAEERKVRAALIASLGQPSIENQIREAKITLLPEGRERDRQELKLLEAELAAEKRKLRLALERTKDSKTRKQIELTALQEEGRLQDQINQLKQSQAAMSGALQREFISEYQGIVGQYAPNVLGGRGAGASPTTIVHVHQNFPHPPTVDGHREATYARHAAMAAFD